MPRIQWALVTALIAGAVLATPASALYIQTPLILSGPEHADVGDDVSFEIRPDNASAEKRFAGKTVRIVYLFDPNESNDPDAPVSSDSLQERLLAELVLDGKASATFRWSVPEEVRDLNVDIAAESGDERVAFTYLAIGDAPPQMRILAGSGPAGEVDQENVEREQVSEDAPGLSALAALATIGAVLALRRK